MKQALFNIDYTPVRPRSFVQRSLDDQIKKRAPGYEFKIASEKQLRVDFNASDSKEKSPLWKFLNFALGAATFFLVAYFMIQMK